MNPYALYRIYNILHNVNLQSLQSFVSCMQNKHALSHKYRTFLSKTKFKHIYLDMSYEACLYGHVYPVLTFPWISDALRSTFAQDRLWSMLITAAATGTHAMSALWRKCIVLVVATYLGKTVAICSMLFLLMFYIIANELTCLMPWDNKL